MWSTQKVDKRETVRKDKSDVGMSSYIHKGFLIRYNQYKLLHISYYGNVVLTATILVDNSVCCKTITYGLLYIYLLLIYDISLLHVGLGPRKFKTKYTEVGDRSVWTRMPGEPPPTVSGECAVCTLH